MRKIGRSLVPVLLAALAGGAAAQEKKKIEIIVFPGGHNWPIWAAQKNGNFASGGIEVVMHPTPNSQFQMTNTYAGKFHVAMTAIDNVIAYQEGQGPAPVEIADMVAVMGGDNGFLSFVTVPEIKSYAELKGKTLSVDALTTGYAFVLRTLLEKNGIKESDVSFARAGGVRERWMALEKKEHAGTMLVSPFDIVAKARGYNVLDYAAPALGNYQGLVAAVTRRWAGANEASLVAYIKGYVQATGWLYDRKNKAEAIAILRQNMSALDERGADAAYAALLGEQGGLFKDGAIDIAGVKTVLALRAKYADPKKELGEPAKYVDTRYLEKSRQ